MKIKQFFVDNKDKLKKLFQFLLCIFLVLFYSITIFACGYNSKQIIEDSNKKELVLKREAYDDNFSSSNLTFQVGTMAPYNRLTQYFEFYYNINYIIFGIDQSGVEININYDLVTRVKYQNGINYDYWATMNRVEFDTYYSIETQAISDYSDLECLRIVFNTTQIDYEGGWDDTYAYFDLGIYDDINIYLNNISDQEHHWGFTNSQSTGIDASNLPVSVRQYINSIISDIDDVRAITHCRTNSFIFNTDYAGYNEGYNEGYLDGSSLADSIKDEFYNNGYQQGLADGRAEANAILKPFELMILGVEPVITVLSSEIAPGITIGTIALIPLAVTMIVFLLKGLVM